MNNHTLFGFTMQEWEIINSFANWFAATGTIAAVVVSLWLARRQDRPRVSLQAEISSVWFEKESDKNREYLMIRAANIGVRPVTISHLSIRFGCFRKVWVAVPLPDLETSSTFPTELSYGKEASWYVPLEKGEFKWQENISRFLAESFKNSRIRCAAVFATTTTGILIKANSSSSIKAAFNKCLK